ncbi:MAG: hypothetical protein ACE5G1_10040 [bacterium]
MKVTKGKVYVFAFIFFAIPGTIAVLIMLWNKSTSPYAAKSFHDKVEQLKKVAEEANPDQLTAVYQARGTREMAERLRKMAEETNPDKWQAYFKNKKRPDGLLAQLQLDATLALERLLAGQSGEAVQQFSRILQKLSRDEQGIPPS